MDKNCFDAYIASLVKEKMRLSKWVVVSPAIVVLVPLRRVRVPAECCVVTGVCGAAVVCDSDQIVRAG